MKKIVIVLISILLLILQVSITPYFKIGWINYNLVLTSVILVTLLYDRNLALVNALICGFLYDIVASRYLGVYTALFLLTVVVVTLISKMMYKKMVLSAVLITFVMTVVTELAVYWMFYVLGGAENNTFVLSKIILPQALVNSGVSVVLFFLYYFLYRKLDFKEDRW